MSTFEETFALTMAAPNPRSAIEALGLPNARARQPGVYAQGVVVLLSDDFAMDCFEPWPPFSNNRFAPIAYTALGDFILWDRQKNKVQYLDVQQAKLTKAAETIDASFDEAFTRPEVVEDVLLRPHIEQIVRAKGALRYGDCFILSPWPMIGGSSRPENYSTGDARVYVNLVGQTHFADA